MVPTHPLTVRTPAARPWVVALTGLALLAASCAGDDDGDLARFCAEVEALRDDDPFADLPVASPQEMRSAFDDLTESVDRIVDAAPPEAETQADRYQDALDDVADHLRGAGFDPRQLDTLAYGRATAAYGEAATSLDNTTDALCG